MARTHYMVTFPNARAGDQVTWPNTVKVYPDSDTQVPLQSGQSVNEALSFSGWSDAASVTFTRAGTSDTVTVTTGSPTGTGAPANTAASNASTGTTIGVATVVDANTVSIAYESPYGIGVAGPYYVDGGLASAGEAAILTVNPTTGDFTLCQPNGVVAL